MKVRIKEKKHNNTVSFVVQVKRGLFWKTLETGLTLENAQSLANDLIEMHNFNNNSDTKNKMVYEGWVVRNVSKRLGSFGHLEIFKSYPAKFNNNGDVLWKNEYGSAFYDIQIRCDKLFGKECLEPIKLRITIEQIEE